MPPNLLVAAGLDPSGGAGLVADVRVAERLGVRPVAVATALTVQDTHGVRRVEPVSVEVMSEQLAALLSDVELGAVKIGMLATEDHAEALADALALTAAPVVWDPVLAPSSGVALFSGDPRRAAAALAPHVSLLTPNLDEASALFGRPVRDVVTMREAAAALRDLGLGAVLIKGGHLEGEIADVLATDDGVTTLAGERVELEVSPHGTGCALSTAIACKLALGATLVDACRDAAELVRERLRAPARPGRGRPAVL